MAERKHHTLRIIASGNLGLGALGNVDESYLALDQSDDHIVTADEGVVFASNTDQVVEIPDPADTPESTGAIATEKIIGRGIGYKY